MEKINLKKVLKLCILILFTSLVFNCNNSKKEKQKITIEINSSLDNNRVIGYPVDVILKIDKPLSDKGTFIHLFSNEKNQKEFYLQESQNYCSENKEYLFKAWLGDTNSINRYYILSFIINDTPYQKNEDNIFMTKVLPQAKIFEKTVYRTSAPDNFD